MGGQKKKNGKHHRSSKRSTAVGWIEPPPVVTPAPDLDRPAHHSCGTEGVYTGMMQLAPGHDRYQVSFVCPSCNVPFAVSMNYESARKIRVRGYALQGIELCNRCGDPLLDKDGKPHRHDDVKSEEKPEEKPEEKSA